MADEPGPMIPGRQAPPAKPKRFYAEASVAERDGGFALLLDGRPARTPARRPLALPSARATVLRAFLNHGSRHYDSDT